jgi:hypothetical protein
MGARVLRSVCVLASVITVAAIAASCADPVHDQLVTSLGPEDPTVPQGEFHRAGQPCTICHGPEGPAKTQFAVAGTIFWHKTQDTIGVNQAGVSVVDSLGANPVLQTNCVGNFFIKPEDWPGGNGPAFPIKVSVFTDQGNQTMTTPINRFGSCGECHFDPANYNAVGHVWMIPDGAKTDPLPQDCPVNPQVTLTWPGPP